MDIFGYRLIYSDIYWMSTSFFEILHELIRFDLESRISQRKYYPVQYMESFSINELGGLITMCAGAVATILFAISKSKCARIKCCCMECERPVEVLNKTDSQPPPEDIDTAISV